MKKTLSDDAGCHGFSCLLHLKGAPAAAPLERPLFWTSKPVCRQQM